MLGAAVAILLLLLPLQVNGLITTDAKCLSGYEWTFSSIGQSPCDVAAELATVCVGAPFNLQPLSPGLIYVGPTKANQNVCRCSSVYYSLLSACSYCQGLNYIKWSLYYTNCTTVFLKVYNENIPDGVKVPAYAYQDVSVTDSFDVIVAQSVRGVESTRLQQASTSRSTLPFSAVSAQSNSGNNGNSGKSTNSTPAIVGGVVGGVVALGLIAALIIFLLLRSKQKTQKYNSSFQLNPSILQSISPPPGSPGGRVYNSDDRSVDPNIDPNRPLSSNITGSSGQNHTLHTIPNTSKYSGMPEL